MQKIKYNSPKLTSIPMDNEVSLQLQSAPPAHPWETSASALPGFGF